MFVHDLSARAGRGALAWGGYQHISTKRYPQMRPQGSVAVRVVKVCLRVESVNDSKLPISELHEKYRLKRRSTRSTSAPMICAANENSESIIYIK